MLYAQTLCASLTETADCARAAAPHVMWQRCASCITALGCSHAAALHSVAWECSCWAHAMGVYGWECLGASSGQPCLEAIRSMMQRLHVRVCEPDVTSHRPSWRQGRAQHMSPLPNTNCGGLLFIINRKNLGFLGSSSKIQSSHRKDSSCMLCIACCCKWIAAVGPAAWFVMLPYLEPCQMHNKSRATCT